MIAKRINHGWRLLVTALAFVLFGLGATLFTLLIFPLLFLLPGGHEGRRDRAQRIIRYSFAALVRSLVFLGVMRLRLINVEAMASCPNMLIFANHPTYLDVVVMLSLMQRSSCVVNSKLWRSPFYGGVVRMAGYIRNDRSDSLINHSLRVLDQGLPLIIFPEGTRTIPGQPLQMQRGASRIAIRSGRDILPVIIHCDPPALVKGVPWYRIPPRPFTITMRVNAPVRVAEQIGGDLPESLKARRLTTFLENYFTAEKNRYE